MAAQVVMKEGLTYDKIIQRRVNEVIDAELVNIESFCEKLTCDKISVW